MSNPQVLKFAILNDIHYTRQAPEGRGPNYGPEILEMLRVAGQEAVRQDCWGILCTGDWFHRKHRVSPAEINDMLAILAEWRERGLHVAGILGNHDLSGHDLDEHHERAAGALVRSGLLHLLDRTGEIRLPFIRIRGRSYRHDADASTPGRIAAYGLDGDSFPQVVIIQLVHAALVLDEDFPAACTTPADLARIVQQHSGLAVPRVIACGHMHATRPVTTRQIGPGGEYCTFIRAGSVGRVSSDDLARQPVMAILSVPTGDQLGDVSVTYWPLPCRVPASASEASQALAADLPGDEPARRESGEVRLAGMDEFVREIRQDAESRESFDPTAVLERAAARFGYGPAVLARARQAVQARAR